MRRRLSLALDVVGRVANARFTTACSTVRCRVSGGDDGSATLSGSVTTEGELSRDGSGSNKLKALTMLAWLHTIHLYAIYIYTAVPSRVALPGCILHYSTLRVHCMRQAGKVKYRSAQCRGYHSGTPPVWKGIWPTSIFTDARA